MGIQHEAEIVREYGPFAEQIHGVTFDGTNVWCAIGSRLVSFTPETGTFGRSIEVRAKAGSAFDGRFIFQIADGKIQKVDPKTGEVVLTLPTPDPTDCAGLTWAEGSLWVGLYGAKKILELDPKTGRVLRTIPSPRMVTGVTFANGELWHGTNDGEGSDLRRVDVASGEVLAVLTLPKGKSVSGLESDGRDLLYAGGGASGVVRAIRRPSSGR